MSSRWEMLIIYVKGWILVNSGFYKTGQKPHNQQIVRGVWSELSQRVRAQRWALVGGYGLASPSQFVQPHKAKPYAVGGIIGV